MPEEQIQPASIDLRLDSVFWRQTSRSTIDLRRSKLLELSPRRYWTKSHLDPGECVVLKPGQMVLGRTFEVFTIPTTCAGKLEGRSSFARMGIAVHCSADFINPGYRGRMPLQLINHGKAPVRIFPHIPVCQLVLVKLSSEPDRAYGARELSSKYMDDDGGPSYWWRDKRIRGLQKAIGEHDVAQHIQDAILDIVGHREPELIERFESTVNRMRVGELSNADDVLDRFARYEDHRRLVSGIRRGVLVGAAPVASPPVASPPCFCPCSGRVFGPAPLRETDLRDERYSGVAASIGSSPDGSEPFVVAGRVPRT
ncbi:dCTP deaminase [Patescibacteria group bacterium]|nr:MAG: dCTP deaminase [Patescibacteria group bacterium]